MTDRMKKKRRTALREVVGAGAKSLVLLCFTLCFTCVAAAQITSPTPPQSPTQTPAIAEASARAKMEASLEKQRVSVRRQVTAAVAVSEVSAASWFTVPWENPPAANPVAATPLDCPELAADRVDELIERTATGEKLSPVLLKEVVRQESGFQPCAVSGKGAMGLMQLMPDTAAGFGLVDAFDPEANLAAGAKYLARLIEKYSGDRKLALAAYNAGAERVTQYQGVPPFPETENYVKEILDRVEAIRH